MQGSVIFVITTDGYENSSQEFNSRMIHYMINEQKQHYGWKFLFFGADIDTQAVGEQIGIAQQDTFHWMYQ